MSCIQIYIYINAYHPNHNALKEKYIQIKTNIEEKPLWIISLLFWVRCTFILNHHFCTILYHISSIVRSSLKRESQIGKKTTRWRGGKSEAKTTYYATRRHALSRVTLRDATRHASGYLAPTSGCHYPVGSLSSPS